MFDSVLSLSWVSVVNFSTFLCHPVVSSVLRQCEKKPSYTYSVMLRKGPCAGNVSAPFHSIKTNKKVSDWQVDMKPGKY